ncbi:hypothetical protein EV1_043121 [Malus domestica]
MTTAETTEGDEIIFIFDTKRRQFVPVFWGKNKDADMVWDSQSILWPEKKELGLDWERAWRWRRNLKKPNPTRKQEE